jgi:Tfp pilus assembly protein PilO
MGFMADFARMPPPRKVLLFVAIGGALGGLYWQFVYKSLVSDLETATVDHDAKTALNKRKDKEIEEYKELKIKVPQLQRIINENQKALPTEAEVSAFFETINRKINEAGAQFIRSKEEPEQPVERFVKVPVTFEMTGTFLQIKRFFASMQPKRSTSDKPASPTGEQGVEERERIVSVENLALVVEPTAKTGQLVLTARFTAATFRQEEAKDATPPGKPSTSPSKPATPAPAKPAPASPPPAATPAGAKARTGSALDKSEERTDSKVGSDRLKGGL